MIYLFLIFVIGCGQNQVFHQKKWTRDQTQAEKQKLLNEIHQQSWQDSQVVEFSNYKVENSTQTVSGQIIFGSFLKTVKSNNSDFDSISVGFFNNNLKPNIEWISDAQINKVYDDFLDKSYKILSFRRVWLHRNNKIEPGVFFALENKKGVFEKILNSKLEVIQESSPESFFDTSTQVYPLGPKRSELNQVWLHDLLDFRKLSTTRLLISSEAKNSDLDLRNSVKYEPLDIRFDQVQAFFHLENSLKWFEKKFNYRPAQKIEAIVNFGHPDKTNAAFYYAGKIRIGDGDGVNYSKLAHDPSIVIHEAAHSVIETVARLPFEGEGGSINEGFADFFAAAQLNNPYMGEVAFLKGPYKRNLNHLVRWDARSGGLYHDSHILSGLLWEIRSSLGESASLKLASLLLVEMNPKTNFQDLAEMLPRLIDRHFEPGEIRKVKSILKTRGFP